MSRLRPSGDSGAYAILYGLLLLVVLGMAALVVDLGQLRANRRDTRLAADAAAVAGARKLDVVGGTANPREACTQAWSYLATNLDFTPPASTGCTNLPTTATPCPSSALQAIGTVGKYTVVITWPVANDSTLLSKPDVKPAVAGATDQAYDANVDGSDPCARIAVQVQADQDPAFASVFGADGASTVVTSVARSTNKPGVGGPIAALNVLEQKDCDAIQTGGQSAIEISAVGDRPGIIAVESSGRQSLGVCPASAPWVIDGALNSSGGHIWANGPAVPPATGLGGGTILSYAMNTAPTGNPLQAYNPANVLANLLLPKPTLMAQRFGPAPVTDIYKCTGPVCSAGGGNYIAQLVSAYDSATPTNYLGSPSPYDTQAFKTVSVANGVAGWSCTIGVGTAIRVPAGNWYVDCDSLKVQGTLIFTGGNVVVKGKAGGGIELGTSGCFAVNVPMTTATCPALDSSNNVTPAPAKESILFLRAGNFTKGSQASVFTARTFVYMKSGHIDLGGGGTGKLYLTNPLPDPTTCDVTCQAKRFGKLTVWNESSETQSMGGQAGIGLRGVLFVPNATFSYAGQGVQVQTAAQFWALKIAMSGQGTLKMAPDPTSSVERPELSTALIR